MKTIAAALLLALSAGAGAWTNPSWTSPSWVQPQAPTVNQNTIHTTQGTFAGQDMNLQTFGSPNFSTTTGTFGGQSVNCVTSGFGAFKTTTCN